MKKIIISPKKDLVFDLKVREMCKFCKRFGKKANCAPYIESVEYYEKLLTRYRHGVLIYRDFLVYPHLDVETQSKKSSMEIYKKVIEERNKLFAQGHYLFIGFGAGSCKVCKTCTFPCNKPQEALMPLEATGMDVVRVLKKFDVKVEFPVNEHFHRVGAVFYD